MTPPTVERDHDNEQIIVITPDLLALLAHADDYWTWQADNDG